MISTLFTLKDLLLYLAHMHTQSSLRGSLIIYNCYTFCKDSFHQQTSFLTYHRFIKFHFSLNTEAIGGIRCVDTRALSLDSMPSVHVRLCVFENVGVIEWACNEVKDLGQFSRTQERFHLITVREGPGTGGVKDR